MASNKHVFIVLQLMLLCLGIYKLPAQSLLFPADYLRNVNYQKQLFTDTSNSIVHTSFYPLLYSDKNEDYVCPCLLNAGIWKRKFLYESLIQFNVNDTLCGVVNKFKLSIDPVFNFLLGTDLADSTNKKRYTNSRGILVKASVNNKLKIETAFFENQSMFVNYVDEAIKNDSVVMGQGRYKNFKSGAYDYAFSTGVLAYTPTEKFSLQLGHGKQKVGNGYRSLLLSDNSFNYPFARIETKFFKGKLQYNVVYASLMNLNAGTKTNYSEKMFQKKAASFQHLSWQPTSLINVSFFQGLIWQAPNYKNNQNIELNFINPLIFTNAAIYGLNNAKNNVIIGADIQWKIYKTIGVYTQVMLDELGQNGIKNSNAGIQGGIKWFDLFGVENLFFQAEINKLNNFNYFADKGKSYTHYNQNLAFPISAKNINELVGILCYTKRRLFFTVKSNYQKYDSEITGESKSVFFNDASVSYSLNMQTNMNLCFGINWRDEVQKKIMNNAGQKIETRFFYISFKTSLYNVYLDF